MSDERFTRFGGCFRNPALEGEFRKATRDEWARRASAIVIAGSLMILLFSYVSYHTLGPGIALAVMLTLRLALLATSIGIAAILSRSDSPVTLDRAALTFMLLTSVVVFFVVGLEHKGMAREAPATLLAIVSFFLFVPTRWSFQLASSLFLSVGFLAAQAAWGQAGAAEWGATIVQFLICNALGGYTALRNHKTIRREFLALRRARLMGAEETRHKEELQDSVIALKRSNDELEQFADVVSHDLQTPLRNLISFSQLLQRRSAGALDEKSGSYVKTIVQAADHMQHLVTDLLAFARVGRSGLPSGRVDMGEILTQVEYQFATAIRETQAQVTHDPLPIIPGRPMEVLQLFGNLIDNALKFKAPGVPPRIHVSAKRSRTYWEFSVRDNGIGIASQHREKVFSIFQRLNSAPDYKGTGIGLAICQKIVEQHGGHIWVNSEPGRGSTFSFTLPSLFSQAFPPAA